MIGGYCNKGIYTSIFSERFVSIAEKIWRLEVASDFIAVHWA